MKKRLLIILAFLLIGLNLSVQAYDFSSVISQNTIYFKIKDSVNKYVEVTSEFDTGLFYNSENKPKGSVIIPSSITNNGIKYLVVSIGDNAFSGCDSISSLSIPNTVSSIANSVLNNCTGLTSITFLGLPPVLSSNSFINTPANLSVSVYCNLGLVYLSTPNFNFFDIQEMPCPTLTNTTEYVEIKGTNSNTNLYLQGGSGLQWVKKGSEDPVFYPGGHINVSNSSNKTLIIYGDFTYLKCDSTSLNYIDISHSSTLENLNCSGNIFESLSLHSQILKTLSCGGSQLKHLDLSGSILLDNLVCKSNQLESLNLSGCTSLEKLNFSSPSFGILKNINLSGCTALKEANFSNQKSLKELNISNLPLFTTLKCDKSSLSTVISDNSPNFDTLYCKQISSSCTYDSLFASLKVKAGGRIGYIYYGDSITAEQSSCRDYTAISKGWKIYYKIPTGARLLKAPNTAYSCYIVTVQTDVNESSYGYVRGGGSYEEENNVILEAIPYENNVFLYWSDNQNNTNPIRTISAKDTTFKAIFRHFDLIYDTISICQAEAYQFFDTSLMDAGNYIYDDSITATLYNKNILNLNLKPIFNTTITAFICQGSSYTENGFNQNTTGTYTDTLQAINGCDSIIHLELTVNPIYIDTITAYICQGETYTQFGFNEYTAGVYTQNLEQINGCDSIVNLSLIINPIHNDTIIASICRGETYSSNGFNQNTAGFYSQNLQDINGCDSISNLSLAVTPIYNATINAAIFDGSTYTLNGFNQSTEGLYSQNLQTIKGCDSIINLNLIVYPVYTTMLEASICEGSTYTENGFNESIAGIYSQTLQSISGSDSIVSLNLTINPKYNDTINASICQGETYTLFGFNESEAGFYIQNQVTVNGCDSIINLNLTVNPVYNDTIIAVICQGEIYNLFGFNETETGFYSQNLQTVKGCDSILNLSLIANPSYNDTLTVSICDGETYTLNGFNENLTGIYTQSLQTTEGCDSIVNLNLVVNPIYNDTIIAEICQGEIYNLFGFNEIETGFFIQSLETITGCDSIINLNLIVNPSYHDTINASICEGNTYTLYGFNENETGFYSQNLQTLIGCDSIITLNLNVNPNYNDTIRASICEGETYFLDGFNESIAGFYTQNLQTIEGCDSIVNLNLIVNPIFNDTIIAEICQGEIYNLFGFNERESGFYTHSLETIKGCDSIVNLRLIVNPSYHDTITASICQGNTYTLYGFNENLTGFYTQDLQTIEGCDSIINLNLTVNPGYNDTIKVGICQGKNYTLNGFNQSEAGLYTQNLETINGCDSIVNLNLIVYPNYLITHYDTICQGESYNGFGFNFVGDTSGTFTRNLQTINGCDSIIKLNLIVNPVYDQLISASICNGLTYDLFGFNETVTGFYTQTLQTTKGCDSIVNLSLTVYPYYLMIHNDSACKGETYNKYGFSLVADSSNQYTQNLQTINGCDSIVKLNLVVNTIYTNTITATTCKGTPYTLNGFNQSTTGIYTQTLQRTTGCDSIINLNLTVNPSYNDTIVAEICQGSTYTLNGFNQSTAGLYTKHLQTIKGCDSIVNLKLIVNPTYATVFNATICQGETYNLNDFSKTAAGTYTKNLQTIKGCDSIITLNLFVNPSYSRNIIANICQGETYNQFGFNQNTTGIYTQALQKINGCDSTITLNLTVNPKYNDTITASICRGNTYSLNGFNETVAGTYTHHLQTINGCDSIVTLKLIVNSTYSTVFNATICQGETYNLNGFNKNTTGIYTEILQTTKGCDSIVTLNLVVNPTYNRVFNASICQGSTYSLNGFNQNQTGAYVQNLQTINGCDSTVTLNLIVNPKYNDTIRASICLGSRYTQNGFNENTSGIYTQTLQTTKGCDSIVTLKLTVNSTYSTAFNATICQGETYTENGFNQTTAGFYTRNLQTTNGCDSIVTLNLIVNPSYKKTINATICLGNTYSLNGFNETQTGFYTQTLQTIKGCDSIVNLNLTVNHVSAPTHLLLENIENYFKLSWQGEAERYVIYRGNDSIGITYNTFHKDSTVVSGLSYCYRVKGVSGTCESEKVEVCKEFIGLEDIISSEGISIILYPNPTTGNTVLKVEGIRKAPDVFVYDITGRYLQTYHLEANQKELNIDLTGFAKGIYQVKVMNQTKKLIVN